MFVDGWAFSYCTSLKNISFPSSLLSIGCYAFEHCSSLESISLEKGISCLSTFCFAYCSKLELIEYNARSNYWDDITKELHWNIATGDYIIECTNKNISKANS